MKQYCRYCSHAKDVSHNSFHCGAAQRRVLLSSAKLENICKMFTKSQIDLFAEEKNSMEAEDNQMKFNI